jgi:hypothetical protein
MLSRLNISSIKQPLNQLKAEQIFTAAAKAIMQNKQDSKKPVLFYVLDKGDKYMRVV